jgi:uncharacterized protein (DUF305 family)
MPSRAAAACVRRLIVQVAGVVAALLSAAVNVQGQPVPVASPAVTAADVRFMRDMIGHHQQAVEMTGLVAARSRDRQLRVLAERIAVSQADEIAQMRQWLRAHGAGSDTASSHAAHEASGHDGHDMPGMLSAQDIAALRASRGRAFDRRFLEGMIRHHAGALAMVAELQAVPGAAQESSINRFVTDVDADQRAEIARMRRLLDRR